MRVENISLPKIPDNITLGSNAVQPEAAEQIMDKALDTSTELKSGQQNEEQQIKMAIEHANKALEGVQRHFKYEVHKATKQVIISVIDDKTNEVIGEIPSKKLLDAVAKLWELAGLFVDERR